MTACASWSDRIQEWVDGELPVHEQGALGSHLAACAGCRALHSSLVRTCGKLDDWANGPLNPPAPDLVAALGLEAPAPVLPFARPRRRAVGWAVAAAVAMIAIGLSGPLRQDTTTTASLPAAVAPSPVRAIAASDAEAGQAILTWFGEDGTSASSSSETEL